MTNKSKCYLILVIGLAFLLATSVVGCGKSSEITSVETYLTKTESIIDEATEISTKISNLYETTTQLDLPEVVQKCAIYGEQYDDLLKRLVELRYPKECLKYREYIVDGITYSKQEVTEFGALFATGDIEHLYKAESYYNDAQKSLFLAAAEWERLTEIVEEEGGIGILEIFLGLLGLGIAVVLAMFVLELTLGVGFGIIAGITAAIGAIINKIKGGRR